LDFGQLGILERCEESGDLSPHHIVEVQYVHREIEDNSWFMENAAETEWVGIADCIAGISINTQGCWDLDIGPVSPCGAVVDFDGTWSDGQFPDGLADLNWQLREYGELLEVGFPHLRRVLSPLWVIVVWIVVFRVCLGWRAFTRWRGRLIRTHRRNCCAHHLGNLHPDRGKLSGSYWDGGNVESARRH